MFFSSKPPTYESIPLSETNSGTSSEGLSSKRKLVIPFAVVFFAGIFFGTEFNQDTSASPVAESLSLQVPKSLSPDETVNFPKMIAKTAYGTPTSPKKLPKTTKEAIEMDWIKVDEPCNEKLGEAWRIGGERSRHTCITLYFTPQVGDAPGYISAIEADYYDNVEENLVGRYFKPAAYSKDGTYWSIAVLLRKPTKQGLCDTSEHVGIQEKPYIAVAPELVNNVYPTNSNDPEMKERFVEGMCQNAMGYHWFSDVVSGAKLTYKAENLNPVTPMYNSVTGEFQAFYFIATDVLKRYWPTKECGYNVNCAKDKYANMWDALLPGLFHENKFPYFWCSQFCDPDCQWTGGGDFEGILQGFTTMHIFFDRSDTCKSISPEIKEKSPYPPEARIFFCRDPDSYPSFYL